jgi:GNAT superfamily N-acetyltransferase
MVEGLVVRSAERADFVRWLPLWKGYNAFYEREGPTAISMEMTQTTWERFFDGYEPMHALVAEQGDRLLGMTHYIFHRNTTMTGPVCYLQDLFTDGDARGKGVGRALIEGVTSGRAKPAPLGFIGILTRPMLRADCFTTRSPNMTVLSSTARHFDLLRT